VWWLLHSLGASYPRAVAQALDANEAAVSGALSSLARRGLAVVAYRQGRRVFYWALGQPPTPRACTPSARAANVGEILFERESDVRPLADTQSALDVDLALMHAAHSVEVEALIATNRPVPGL
jgi:hypothetical protein